MFGSLGGPEIAILLLFWVVPAIVLWRVAGARGQTRLHILWAILGWMGLIIGLLVMIAMPRRSAAVVEKTSSPPRTDIF